MDKKIIWLIVAGLAIFILAFGAGIFLQQKNDAAKVAQAKNTIDLLKSLSSDIVTTVAGFGQVSEIKGRDITISHNGKTLTVNVGNNVPVILVLPPVSGQPSGAQQTVNFSDIKKGQNINVAFKVSEDGKLTAQTVLILSTGK